MSSPVLLYIEANGATLVTDGAPPQLSGVSTAEVSAEQTGRAIGSEIERQNWINRPIIIALASGRVFAGRFPLDRSLMRRKNAVAFALEDKFPVDAEDMLYRTIDLRDGTHFIVVTGLTWLREFLAGLGSHVSNVRAVIPASLLAVQECIDKRLVPSSGRVFLAKQPPLEAIDLQDGIPSAWSASVFGKEAIQISDNWDKLGDPKLIRQSTLLQFSGAEDWMANGNSNVVEAGNYLETIRDSAAKIASGRLKPWVSFPIETMHAIGSQRSTHALATTALTSLLLLGLFCTSAFLGRTWRIQNAISVVQQEKEQLVAELFPGEGNIRSIERQLQIEHEDLAQLTTEARRFSQRQSALSMLYEFLSAFPEREGIEIAVLQVSPERATLRGKVPSLDQLDRLTKALQIKGVHADQLKYGLEFELQIERTDEGEAMPVAENGQ